MKTLKIEAKKAYRGSVTFNVTKDGSLEQVINLYKAAEEPTSVVLHATPHGKLSATKHGLSIGLAFPREKMDYDEIIAQFYAETDEMAEYLGTHQPEIREQIRQAFEAKKQTLIALKGGEAA